MSLETSKSLSLKVRQFVDENVIPHEPLLAAGGESAKEVREKLIQEAKKQEIWGNCYPIPLGGKFKSLTDYFLVAEQEGRSEYSPGILGCDATLDTHMMLKFGTTEIQERFLKPLAQGNMISCYGMTESERSGSIPQLIRTSAKLSNGQWTINGKKWFITNAARANFVTVLCRTQDDPTSKNFLSMVVVPTNTPGFKIERSLDILGRVKGHAEISFQDVQVPESYVLGEIDGGVELMRNRLGMGRLLRAMRWVGLAQRSFDLMCERVNSSRGVMSRLPDKQLIRQHVYEAYESIASARELIKVAAQKVDSGQADAWQANSAKVAASRALWKAADSAVQVHGTEGLSDLTPLSGIFRLARSTRLLDAPEETLVSSMGRDLLKPYQSGAYYEFAS